MEKIMKLLQIDASPRQDSVSRQLTSHFAENWKQQVPGGQVTHRDLANSPLGLITDDWIAGAFSNPAQHTTAHRSALQYSDKLIEELHAADVIVIGDPMHNFTISARLKAWLDQVVRFGKTFSYGESGPKGLLSGKKVYVFTSRGGAYEPGTPTARFDFQEPYLRHVLAFIGLTDVTFIHAENQSKSELAPAARAAAMQKIEDAVAV
jgi:FMN-dependent NADH-azoreductase